MLQTLPTDIWLERCERRLSELEDDIADTEARRLARQLHEFERTRAMAPEEAANFVAERLANLASPNKESARFERRQTHRA